MTRTFFSSLLLVVACCLMAGCAGGSSTTPVTADNPVAAACLADIHATCESALDACENDSTCAAFASACVNGANPAGAVECLSAAQGQDEGALFQCLYFSTPCNASQVPQSARDAGPGGG